MKRDNTREAFLALVKAGLWEKDISLSEYDEIDFGIVLQLAQEQAVVGLVAAGLEHVKDVKIPQNVALEFVGNALQLEQRNKAMNSFVSGIIERMRKADIYALLVKGQGIAQCYERPLWRACGDIDLFLSEENYKKAKSFLLPIASLVEEENKINLHQGVVIEPWTIELHGTLRSGLWRRVDSVVDEAQKEVFYSGRVRSWMNGNTQVFLPRADEDIVFVFSHILQHYFRVGIGLRQICDWSRLLWKYKDTINKKILEERIRKMGVVTEWKAFAALAVETLGMDTNAMPLFSNDIRWKKKAEKVLDVVMKTGNLGHNIDLSYQAKYTPFLRKIKTYSILTKESLKHIAIFPLDSIKAWWYITAKGINGCIQ